MQGKDNKQGNNSAWTYGFPQCMNKKQSRLVCLHKNCQKYPFFCSTCEDQSCQRQHQHQDRITSIGFKELIRKLISERKIPEKMENSVNNYKKILEELKENVTKFVQEEIKSADQILKKQMQLAPEQEEVIRKMKQKKYNQVKGKELDRVWRRVAPTEQSKKRQKETVQFLDSKRVQVQQLNEHFLGMIAANQSDQGKDKSKGNLPVKSQIKPNQAK